MSRQQAWWKAHQNRIEPSHLFFIDATWTKTNIAPLRRLSAGRAAPRYLPKIVEACVSFDGF